MGRTYGWALETGTICQLGIFTWKRCIQKGSFTAILHYIFNECRANTVFNKIATVVVRKRRTWPFLGLESALFCCKKANLKNGARSCVCGGGGGNPGWWIMRFFFIFFTYFWASWGSGLCARPSGLQVKTEEGTTVRQTVCGPVTSLLLVRYYCLLLGCYLYVNLLLVVCHLSRNCLC